MFGVSKTQSVRGLFEILYMFFPMEGATKAVPMGSIEKSFHFILVTKRCLGISNTLTVRDIFEILFTDGYMDGMGWDGSSKLSFNFLYTLWVYSSCIICTFIYNQKLSPTFIWISKFDVKLGSGGMIFKITIYRCALYFSC